jgi:hypothetical protein
MSASSGGRSFTSVPSAPDLSYSGPEKRAKPQEI